MIDWLAISDKLADAGIALADALGDMDGLVLTSMIEGLYESYGRIAAARQVCMTHAAKV